MDIRGFFFIEDIKTFSWLFGITQEGVIEIDKNLSGQYIVKILNVIQSNFP